MAVPKFCAYHAHISVLLLHLMIHSSVSQALFPPAILQPKDGTVESFFIVAATTTINRLTCTADRPDSQTQAFWRQQGRNSVPSAWMIKNDVGSQTITVNPGIPPSDLEGIYECVVTNPVATVVSGPVKFRFASISLNDTYTATAQIKAKLGDTLALKCSSVVPSPFQPTSYAVPHSTVWYKKVIPLNIGDPTIVALKGNTDPRLAIDERETLYVRNLQRSDVPIMPATDGIYQCKVASQLVLANAEIKLASYNDITIDQQPAASSGVRLKYQTPSVDAPVGSPVYLSCIFEDSASAYASTPVQWTKLNGPAQLVTPAYQGSLLGLGGAVGGIVNPVTPDYAGDWNCTYGTSGVSATIHVNIQNYPVIQAATLVDKYLNVGDTLQTTCSLVDAPTQANPVKFEWLGSNNTALPPQYKTEASSLQSTLTLTNVQVANTGIVTCSASNILGVMQRSIRVIVTAPSVIRLAAIGGSTATDYTITNATTTKFNCSYTLDQRATFISLNFKLANRRDPIDDKTSDPVFGITQPAVVQTSPGVYELTLHTNILGVASAIVGNVTCLVKYSILDIPSITSISNVGNILPAPPRQEAVTAAQFPYWIIGVIVAVLFLALLVFLIIFCVKQNKGEQYYVGEKEVQAGYNPEQEMGKGFQDFHRPDQDPVKGSRASLEMGGDDRPMGSDTGSMDEYGAEADTGKFNEDGSFIGQYGQKSQRQLPAV